MFRRREIYRHEFHLIRQSLLFQRDPYPKWIGCAVYVKYSHHITRPVNMSVGLRTSKKSVTLKSYSFPLIEIICVSQIMRCHA